MAVVVESKKQAIAEMAAGVIERIKEEAVMEEVVVVIELIEQAMKVVVTILYRVTPHDV